MKRLRRRVRLLFAFAALAFAGCASPLNTFNVAITNAAVAATGGYRALELADSTKQDAIRERAKVDPIGAKAELADYLAKYAVARKVLDEAQDAVEIAAAASDVIRKGGKAPRPLSSWAVDLLALVPRIIAALNDLGLGVSLPVAPDLGGGKVQAPPDTWRPSIALSTVEWLAWPLTISKGDR